MIEKFATGCGIIVLLATCTTLAPTFFALLNVVGHIIAIGLGAAVSMGMIVAVVAGLAWSSSRQQDRAIQNRQLALAEMQVMSEVSIAQSRARLAYADINGAMPVSIDSVANGSLDQAVLMFNVAMSEHKRTFAPVPNTVHYSVANDATYLDGPGQEAQPDQIEAMPSFAQLLDGGLLPSRGYMLGIDYTGQSVVANAVDFGSVLVAGRSGSGKTNLAKFLAAQATMQGIKLCVVDPEYGTGGDSLLEVVGSLPIEHRAVDDKSIVSLCDYIKSEAERNRGKDEDRLVLIVDEFNSLLRRSATGQSLIDMLYEVGARGRKRGVYAWCFAQAAGSNHIPTEIRDLFVGIVGMNGSAKLFGHMLDKSVVDKIASLPKYHIVFHKFDDDDAYAVVPQVDGSDIELLSDGDGSYGAKLGASEVLPDHFSTTSDPLLSDDIWGEDDDLEVPQKYPRSTSEAPQKYPDQEGDNAQSQLAMLDKMAIGMLANDFSSNRVYEGVYKGKGVVSTKAAYARIAALRTLHGFSNTDGEST